MRGPIVCQNSKRRIRRLVRINFDVNEMKLLLRRFQRENLNNVAAQVREG
jgi:hypothetical protein